MNSVGDNKSSSWLGYFGFVTGEETHSCDEHCKHEEESAVKSFEEHKCDDQCEHGSREEIDASSTHECHRDCSHNQSFWGFWTRSTGGEQELYCQPIGEVEDVSVGDAVADDQPIEEVYEWTSEGDS